MLQQWYTHSAHLERLVPLVVEVGVRKIVARLLENYRRDNVCGQRAERVTQIYHLVRTSKSMKSSTEFLNTQYDAWLDPQDAVPREKLVEWHAKTPVCIMVRGNGRHVFRSSQRFFEFCRWRGACLPSNPVPLLDLGYASVFLTAPLTNKSW